MSTSSPNDDSLWKPVKIGMCKDKAKIYLLINPSKVNAECNKTSKIFHGITSERTGSRVKIVIYLLICLTGKGIWQSSGDVGYSNESKL